MKKVLKILGIILLVLIVIGMFGNKKEQANTEEPVQEVEKIEEAAEEVVEEEDYQLSVDDIITMYKLSLAQNFTDEGQGYEVTQSDKSILINLWSNGITEEAVKALVDDKYKEAWDNMVESFKNTSETYQKTLDDNGHSDISAIINILNDVSKDKIILSISKGTVLYDAVNGIDLIS